MIYYFVLSTAIILSASLSNAAIPDHFVTTEKAAIEMGRHMLQSRLQNPPPKNSWLCATFMKGSAAEADLVTKNVKNLSCDWAVIFYSNTTEARQFQPKICSSLNERARVRHCQGTVFNKNKYRKLVEEYTSDPPIKLLNHSGEVNFVKHLSTLYSKDENIFIAKQIMYPELLPYLKDYERVIVMDSDMRYTNKEFNFTEVKTILQRGYKHPIQLAQSCIVGPVEFSTFHQDRWINQKHIAIGIDFIEQQAFYIDSLLLEWSIRSILAKTIDYHILFLSDWGFDSVLCHASKAFSDMVLSKSTANLKENPVCVILTRHCISHENTRTIKKSINFDKSGHKMFHYYRKFFPHWYFDVAAGLKPEGQYTVRWETALKPFQY